MKSDFDFSKKTNQHPMAIMVAHQVCPDCRDEFLVPDKEEIRQDYYEDGTPSGTTLVVNYKPCKCKAVKLL